MGQSISSAIKSIDGGDASSQETRDTLNALYALGSSRIDTAYSTAVSDRGNVYAGISKILLRKQSIVCKTSTDTNAIVDGIKDSVGNLISGQVLDGVTDLIRNGLNVVLGQSAGQTSSSYTYALVATELGAFLRVDIDVYNFSLESQGLQTKVQNMTAISSLVSSVDPNSLTAGDIRAIVSVTFGGSETGEEGASSLDVQKEILQVVLSAWEMDRKKANDEVVTEEDLAAHRALFRQSHYEAMARSRPTSVLKVVPKTKVDRSALIRGFRRRETTTPNTETPGTGDGQVLSPLVIWIQLSNPADESFLAHFKGALRGFNEDKIFEAIDYKPGLSGNAIGFDCQIWSFGSADLFDLAVSYVEDTVFPSLSSAGYLNSRITSLSMQYDHPSANDKGLPAHIFFKRNLVTNYSRHTITFYEPDTGDVLLTLAPPAGGNLSSGILTGAVDYITGTLSAEGEAEGGDGGDGAETETPTRWVTYEKVEVDTVLTAMAISIDDIEEGGFVMSFTDAKNERATLRYSVGWPGV
jgi:hypothetical protein